MGDQTRFVPVRGKEENIMASAMQFNDGFIYFATDTGRIYLDYIDENGTKVARALVGSSAGGAGNSGIFYANYKLNAEEKLESEIIFPFSDIEGTDYPQKDDIIINTSEGSFYRVLNSSPLSSSVTGLRLTIAGGGGGSSTLAEDIDLYIENLTTSNFINGQDANVYFTATSAKNAKGNEIDPTLTINYTLSYTEDGIYFNNYKTGSFIVNSGERSSFNFGQFARHSSTSRLTLVASQSNSEGTVRRSIDFITSDLRLTLPAEFSNASYYDIDRVTLQCNAIGDMDKIVEYYFDDEENPFYTETLIISNNPSTLREVSPAAHGVTITHGAHKVWIRLYQSINGNKGLQVEPLSFEIAVYDGNPSSKPIIWLGDYKTQYYNYDIIQIPFYAFDPTTSTPIVYFKKNNVELDNSPQEIKNSGTYSYFEIANAEIDVLNRYSISCGEGEKETIRYIELTVVQDPNRTDFGVQRKNFLTYELNTVGSGRSNNESREKRQTLVYNYELNDTQHSVAATFDNFNWYNNGWIKDESNKTCLRISNGAKLSIPIGQMIFAKPSGNAATDLSHTIELCFKVRNVQNYSNLIHNITRYKNDSVLFKAFYDDGQYQTGYTNYDSFLAWYLRDVNPTLDEPVTFIESGSTEPRLLEYDDLEFDHIEKQINLNNILCGYYSGTDASSITGLCLGPQDAFFSNGTNTVSVSYVEDEVITLSVVYQYSAEVPTQNLIYIYLNGVLNSVIQNTKGAFTIESNNIVFDSDTCDIDLYKLRVYRTALNVNDIVMNYAADREQVKIYDQNKLAEENRSINEYQFKYENMIRYNTNHPNEPLMPYIIFDTSESNNDDKLSYAKSVKVPIKVEFVNTALELAYTSGELEQLAKDDGLWHDGDTALEKEAAIKEYYRHHCPSFVGYNVSMAVQGTSSEFYPRRNYKLKTKTEDADGKSRIHIFLNRGPFAEEYATDQAGLQMSKYIISNVAYDSNKKYYADKNGEVEVTFDASKPYEYNKYYTENPNYVELGKEKTRQDFWYMNNYTVGTTKFTMKIDYMESSGSYNMGFANLVNQGYSKHPLDDYNSKNAFVFEDESKTTTEEATSYKAGTTYWYVNHKGNWKAADGVDGELVVDSAEAFAMTPAELWAAQLPGNTANKYATTGDYVGHWYKKVAGYTEFSVNNTNEYRTSVAGFRVLAFHKKSDGSYQYIGMYNMLLDKGSDEVYGFKLDKTAQHEALQKYLKNKKISKIAECWEMENNNRTFCSFRDPLKRKDLSFDVYTMEGNNKVVTLNSVRSAPIVVDSFEYRYHPDADILDYVYNPEKESALYEEVGGDVQSYMTKNNVDLRFNKDNVLENQEARCDFILNTYKNWEKACQWVWSTCTDDVISQGTYEEIKLGLNLWEANTYYIYDLEEKDYKLDDGESYDSNQVYYSRVANSDNSGYDYVNAHVVAENLFNNETKFNYYTQVNGNYVPITAEDEFNDSIKYYVLNNYTDVQLAQKEASGECDRLVEQCTADSIFDSNEIYYIYDGTKQNGHATAVAAGLTETQFNADKTKYWIGKTVTYRNRSYKYDTKEYRADKFVNELTKHFDLEYMATYFVMTEVFECYDSRGKNCMMASWGPQENGGDYIWYPIFYDIDTQLGVNNTGIPSFEYNVDATEDGNYSTSDSVLWNNFYKYFKSSAIIGKYKHLRGADSMFTRLSNPPIRTVDYIEAWYNTDPDVCKQIVMRGERPLIAKNLDEYYKYITITNSASYQNGITGHIQSNTSGEWTYDSEGKYFYMLQGDRQLSRQQFLTNRLDYIDSWLNQGNYQRGGANRIRGRVAANNSTKTSDKWLEPRDGSYYMPGTKDKRYLFDAEYWLTLTPTHSSYVTLGDDNEAYPSQKYDGIHPLRFEISAIESGVRTSQNYPEQLLYIYGMDQMQDLGDMSKLYWQEFAIEGKAHKLTSLRLGYDGLMENPEEGGDPISYQNNNVNQPSIPAGKGALGMPLLKEINLCNMQINSGSPVLDLSSCEKLENFRATGTNYTDIQFADGVALHTVYMPTSLVTLKLTEARLLKNLITSYEAPVLNAEGKLEAQPGLYLQGMFESSPSTNITTLNIFGGGLGYDSYKLLKQYYTIRKAQGNVTCDIQMTNVEWSPYIQVGADEEHDNNYTYVQDNGHYGFEPYIYQVDSWDVKVANGEIYKQVKELTDPAVTQITDIEMFQTFISSNVFRMDTTHNVPNITGIVYINNANSVSEYYIRNTIQPQYPNLTFFFKEVDQSYTAKFLLMEADEGNSGRYTLIGSQTIESGWFENPLTAYADINISRLKPNHDFMGWATTNSLEAEKFTNETWAAQELDENIHTYYFYAICPIHKWTVQFYNGEELVATLLVPHDTFTSGPVDIPYRDDIDIIPPESAPEEYQNSLYWTYQFAGWSRNAKSTTPVDLNNFSIVQDCAFYAVWAQDPVFVYDNIHPEYFVITNNNAMAVDVNGTQRSGVAIRLNKAVKGKLTIPNTIDGKTVVMFQSTISISQDANALVDEYLKNVTHIFFEKNNLGNTNVYTIDSYTFQRCSNLRYFEFANGLVKIGERAFFGGTERSEWAQTSTALIDSTIIGGTVQDIGQHAFIRSFNNKEANKDLIIDGNVRVIRNMAFANNTYCTEPFQMLQIGTPDNKTQITNFNNAFSGSQNKFNSVRIYTANPNNNIFNSNNNYELLLRSLFGDSANLTMPVEVIS